MPVSPCLLVIGGGSSRSAEVGRPSDDDGARTHHIVARTCDAGDRIGCA
ncbi:hypothetical protein ABZY09_48185 [Streptomyces sp. NPDC002928]